MFYVYVYRDPRPSKGLQPVYVGKGTGGRDTSHWLRSSHNKPLQDFLSHLRRNALEPVVERVFDSPDEQAAFAKEVELISLYGRRDTGTGSLFNRTAGGEGASGFVKTDAHKEVDRHGTFKNWQKPEFREKVVAAQRKAQNTDAALATKSTNAKQLWAEQRDKMALGIKRGRATAVSKAKTSAQAKRQWADPEYAAAQASNNREIASRPEVKAAKSAALKARWADPEFKAKMLAARKKP
ncbi:hypothetical protein UFOVP1058_50 [uncultured Caudovirales phage]|uniref:GIY-YIG domain-containing protein n=1 Tax=uncultured Caudovirales phage TaxID=2100421 RepID=A0A6J5T204_9CAUD|nr:hypothetical protein UFOVP656_30 [uncultured Caudovirales phage]CAB4167804.1 hypothetical protein UFOVP857_52 [uncultured Caudovirales phage]CAB4168508.1 hypothetical protein UFOVP879_63 [uncultured Caudovirales phage]CAB4181609.1 hypothetical protein UFOVP1058_50 [uncultured Caudovirales phage]CAB4195228.1 hypothetical protein UFOVP1289_5 [uncultured Caudovirales phage]